MQITDSFTPRAMAFLENESALLDRNFIDYPESFYQEHFSRSKEAVVQAIDGLKNTALILGAGGLRDIPLLQFCEQFDRVILVDVNVRSTEAAMKLIPQESQGKCSLIQADLTGIFGELSASAEKIADGEPLFDAFISKVLDLLPTLKRKAFDLKDIRPSFISSSLLCSQLSGGVMKFLDQLSKEIYDQPFAVPTEREEEFTLWLTQIQISHLDEVRGLADEKGKVYFADHFSSKKVWYVKSPEEDNTIELGKSYFPGSLKVKSYVEKLFISLNKEKWSWSLVLNESVGTGSVNQKEESTSIVSIKIVEALECRVTSLILSPKSP